MAVKYGHRQEEVCRISLHNQGKRVIGMVVYQERVYVVHYRGLVVYCYNPDGSLSMNIKVEQKLMLRECV